ncbi:MAG: LLM class flavin-dependent oxidoreductase [Actinomycetota bacterium]|nr:LLM class flavin-dependent oxidoreductase [Actinomycetota bacterium]
MIRVGAQYLGGSVSPKDFAVAVERAGFDSVWCGDHVGHYVDGISTLGCYAGCTEAIQIGANVLVAPLRPAVVTAKAISTVARLAGPRFVAGIGVGGDFADEIEAVGADMAHRGAFTDELLAVLPLLLAGWPVDFDGRFTSLRGFRMDPQPASLPPVWIGGRADAALRRAARFGQGYLGYLLSPDGLAKRVARLAELKADGDPPGTALQVACNVFFVPARTTEEAVDAVATSGLAVQGLTGDMVRKVFLLGDDESCLARIRHYVDAGLEHLILGCAPGGPDDLRSFLEATSRLLPEIRAMGGSAAGRRPHGASG